MKIKKYTNGAWTDLDKPVKKYDTYTDETTTLPLTIEASTTDAIENYQVYGTSEGAGVETESGEPAGYKIPISNTSGEQQSNYDLFIGDSKLLADEYVDFGEQKVYKITPNNGVSARNPNSQFTIVNNGDGSYRVYHNTISSPYESIQVMPYISGVVHIECDITFNKITTNGFIIGLRNNSNNTFYPAGTGIFVKATGTYKIRKTIDAGDVEVYLSVCDLNSSAVPNQEYDYTISNIRLYVNPQDPPVPLPAIQAYQGENTLSSTETLGEVTVKYEGWKGVGDVEKYESGEWTEGELSG